MLTERRTKNNAYKIYYCNACLIGFGVFLFAMSTFGVFKFKYVLNRMHAAAIGDSLALFSLLAGVCVMTGFTYATLKLVIILVFFVRTPVSSHMIAKMEIATITEEDAEEFKNDLMRG